MKKSILVVDDSETWLLGLSALLRRDHAAEVHSARPDLAELRKIHNKHRNIGIAFVDMFLIPTDSENLAIAPQLRAGAKELDRDFVGGPIIVDYVRVLWPGIRVIAMSLANSPVIVYEGRKRRVQVFYYKNDEKDLGAALTVVETAEARQGFASSHFQNAELGCDAYERLNESERFVLRRHLEGINAKEIGEQLSKAGMAGSEASVRRSLKKVMGKEQLNVKSYAELRTKAQDLRLLELLKLYHESEPGTSSVNASIVKRPPKTLE